MEEGKQEEVVVDDLKETLLDKRMTPDVVVHSKF